MTARVLQVPYIDQSVRYPTGCESVSAVMLLRFLGVEITVDEFIGSFLERRDMEERDGVIYGPDPWKCFCGSPYDEDSFGCYAPVMCNALGKALKEPTGKAAGEEIFKAICEGRYEVVDETGTPTETLLSDYIDKGLPVLYWACINMREPIVGPSWKLYETGEEFTWISNEHCMLLVGYDEEGYYFNDPFENHGLIRYPRALAEDRHAAQHGMAVGVKVWT